MRIHKTGNSIEAFAIINGREQSVIKFSILMGKWHTACSSCFPSSISDAKNQYKAISAAFNELHSREIDSERLADSFK